MSPEAAVQPEILHLSLVVGGALRDSDGERLGSVDDLIVRLGGTGYPPITGFLVSVAGRPAYLPDGGAGRATGHGWPRRGSGRQPWGARRGAGRGGGGSGSPGPASAGGGESRRSASAWRSAPAEAARAGWGG